MRSACSSDVPDGIEIRWDVPPSFPLSVLMNAASFTWLASSSPNEMISRQTYAKGLIYLIAQFGWDSFTFSFFNRFATLMISFSSSTTGEQTNTTIRCLWFLFIRCLSESCATRTAAVNRHSPSASIRDMTDMNLDWSVVNVATKWLFDIVSRAHAFSAFWRILVLEHIIITIYYWVGIPLRLTGAYLSRFSFSATQHNYINTYIICMLWCSPLIG